MLPIEAFTGPFWIVINFGSVTCQLPTYYRHLQYRLSTYYELPVLRTTGLPDCMQRPELFEVCHGPEDCSAFFWSKGSKQEGMGHGSSQYAWRRGSMPNKSEIGRTSTECLIQLKYAAQKLYELVR
jgi:hypothetical protein